jgi:hypothetical protein
MSQETGPHRDQRRGFGRGAPDAKGKVPMSSVVLLGMRAAINGRTNAERIDVFSPSKSFIAARDGLFYS